MSRTNLIRTQVQQAFVQLGDIARPATFQRFTGNIVRDIDAGTSVREVVEYPIPRAMKTDVAEKEVDYAAAVSATQKILFPTSAIPVKPDEDDVVVWEDGVIWEIRKIKTDPAEALWILFVRSTATE